MLPINRKRSIGTSLFYSDDPEIVNSIPCIACTLWPLRALGRRELTIAPLVQVAN